MNHIAPRAEPLIRDIPLSRLALAPENVRKTPPDPQADASLKASIAALGLLENLVVRADETAEDGIQRFAVVAGGRRLKAMQELVADKVFDADHPVPCQVRSGDADPAELSLAENVIRIAMHPADQVVAFSKLADAGQGMELPLDEGILFATYATLRSPSRQGRPSRLEQIVEWLAGSLDEEDRHAFDGVVVFDEAHAMANAAGSKSERGETKPSQQGRAGLRLQNALPDARIAYVSATGATTVPGLAYAGRLGLWAAGETPFEKRVEFVSAMEAGGVAAMEVVARDLKALGLYQARALDL